MTFKDFYLNEYALTPISKKEKKKVKRIFDPNNPKAEGGYVNVEDEEEDDMPETVFGGPGEAEAANKGKKMRKNIPEQPNVAGAPDLINNPGPTYANQPSLGNKERRTYANKNLVSRYFKTNV